MSHSPRAVRTRILPSLAALGFLLGANPSAFAQGQTNPAGSPATHGAQPGATPRVVRMAEEPHRIESIGMSLFLPEGALWEAAEIGDTAGALVYPPPPDESWRILISTSNTGKKDLTVLAVAQAAFDQLTESFRVLDMDREKDPNNPSKVDPNKVKVVGSQNAAVVIESVRELPKRKPTDPPSARFYVLLPRVEGAPVARGYTVFKTGPGQFVGFELFTSEPALAGAKLYYETTVASAAFTDTVELAAARGAAIEAGMAFLGKLQPADYEAVIGDCKDKWFRLYLPAPGGGDQDASELAYSRIRAWKGTRSEVESAGAPAKPGAAEGYLIRVDARYRCDGFLLDSVGTYFMSLDRKEELWTLKNTRRDQDPAKKEKLGKAAPYDKASTSVETGVRSGRQMTINLQIPGREPRATRITVPDRGYLTQVEAFLLGPLLSRAALALDYGFYSYQSRTDTVSLRRDSLTRPAARLGAWELQTRMREDEMPQVSLYDEKGGLIRSTSANGELKEAIQLSRLQQLWTSKGLPTK